MLAILEITSVHTSTVDGSDIIEMASHIGYLTVVDKTRGAVRIPCIVKPNGVAEQDGPDDGL